MLLASVDTLIALNCKAGKFVLFVLYIVKVQRWEVGVLLLHCSSLVHLWIFFFYFYFQFSVVVVHNYCDQPPTGSVISPQYLLPLVKYMSMYFGSESAIFSILFKYFNINSIILHIPHNYLKISPKCQIWFVFNSVLVFRL